MYTSHKGVKQKNKVTLMWVPGHQGIEGNTAVDLLTKEELS